jgi:hypothetical protein
MADMAGMGGMACCSSVLHSKVPPDSLTAMIPSWQGM